MEAVVQDKEPAKPGKADMIETLINLLIFLLILGTAIFIHELGHFMLAVRLGVRIEEFGFGLPPRLLTLGRWRGTAITLNAIPLGGFVRPEGEYDPDKPFGLAASPPRTRLLVLLAGAVSNLLFAFVLLTGAFLIGGPAEGRVRVLAVSPGSPAAAAGLQPDDRIVVAAGGPVGTAAGLRETIESSIGRELDLQVERGGESSTISFVPRASWPEGEGPGGFTTQVDVVRYSLPSAVVKAGEQVWTILRDTVLTLWKAVSGSGGGFRVVGPVGLKQASDWTIEQVKGWSAIYPLLYLAGLINIGLGFSNLLPLPALDGGRIVFVLYEMVTRRAFPFRIERLIQGAGAIAILMAMIALSIMDLRNPLF
jgi:regulator of sigma E protease